MATNGTTAAGLCRLTVRGPETAFDLAVPGDVQLLDLLPTVVGYAGDDLYEDGLEHGGWVLQRLGEEPLDAENTPDALGLHDGDVVYLRPREEALPTVQFDDLVDSVASALRDRADSWRPDLSRKLLLASVLTLLATALVLLAMPGSTPLRCAAAGVAALLLLLGAASASRAMADAVTGTALGAAALPFVALAGGLLPSAGADLLGARLLAGATAAIGASSLAVAVIGASAPFFLGTAVAAALVAEGGLIMVVFDQSLGRAAASIALTAVCLGAFAPAVAFRMSGLRLPPLPGNADQLQEGIEPYEATNVLTRSALANQYTTGVYLALGVVSAAALTGLLGGSGRTTYVLIAALSALFVLHGNRLGALWQRLAVTVPGMYGAVALVIRLGGQYSLDGRLLAFTALLLAACGLAVASWSLPGRRLLPHWAHAANLLQSLVAVSLIPLLLSEYGLYHYLRGLSG